MIDWNKQLERANELSGGLKPKHGDVLELADVISIKEKEETFEKRDGTVNKSIRFVYEFKDKTVVVPITLHRKICQLKEEYNERLVKVKVTVTGTGLNTKYDAMPVV